MCIRSLQVMKGTGVMAKGVKESEVNETNRICNLR